MPYFIDEQDGKYCVRKGTTEDPGEVVKCHSDKASAADHLQALYVNVEDAKSIEDTDEESKGGPGSGWRGPPSGSHTAANAPNFAGGPGANPPRKSGGRALDAEDGGGRREDEEDEDEEAGTHRCKCPKCGNTVVLPKGKICRDIKCTACEKGTSMQDEKPHKGTPAKGEAGKAMDNPSYNVLHGEGGTMSEVSSEDKGNTCPKCGAKLSANVKKCPKCGAILEKEVASSEDKRAMKSEGDGEHPSSHYLVAEDSESSTTWHLRVKDTDGNNDHRLMGAAWAALHGGYRGNKYEGPNKEAALSKLRGLYKSEGLAPPGGDDESEDKKSIMAFKSYQDKDGIWRWGAISSVAIRDKEKELVSTKALQDAVAHAESAKQYGELDVIHVNGTDVGDCDYSQVVGNLLVESGTWRDTPHAIRARQRIRERCQEDPEYWGVSLKFRYNPALKHDGVYEGDIRILKRTILPRTMAASYGTAFVSVGGAEVVKKVDEKAVQVLKDLGWDDAEIEELSQAQKSLPEENVVEKGEPEKEEVTEVKAATLLDQIKGLLGIKPRDVPVAPVQEEAGKATMVNDAPAKSVEPTEEKKAETSVETDPVVTVKMLQATSIEIAKSIVSNMQKALDERDEAIKALAKEIGALRTEMDHSIEDRVSERLRNLPPVVKVQASQIQSTLAPTETAQVEPMTADKRLVADVVNTINKYHVEQKYKA